ncbi:hypothetical protein [Sodalis praecaptivus]|uniref:hypothetical protein n=1 Tax=Sodalis TaxID=84565 RepID=UPI00046CEA7F|nr:hypothetical protein [Sodalis praecaptivus]
MSRQYKIAYEWQEGGHHRSQEVIVESDNELTTASAEVTEAVKNAAAHSANQPQAGVTILSIVPYP